MSTEMNILPPSPPNNSSIISPLEHQQNDDIFIFGKFIYVKDDNKKEMLQNAWTAITQLDLWDYMKRDTDSYMMSSDKEINIITEKMAELGYDGHSGASFGWTMREMQFIAQNGLEAYKNMYMN